MTATPPSASAPPDHFSRVAAGYAGGRPGYPEALFDWLAARCEQHELAVDVGAGTGQAALPLARRFRRVIATDLSAEQLANATAAPNIDWRVAVAEDTGAGAQSADLVTVAQALHWFDLGKFWPEVRRILKPGGLVAVWTYGVLEVGDPQVDGCVQSFYWNRVHPYWPAGREHVENGYAKLSFPFAQEAVPPFAMECRWTLDQFLAYVRTWSAVARMAEATGHDPVAGLQRELAALWGEFAARHTVRWPLGLRAGRP
ncbi:MAG: class I SAM-dependent methyltransferase [Pseudomonadota bacterium]